MPSRRNFDPSKPDSDYEHAHIKFKAVVEVDLHNVGKDYDLKDAMRWLDEALERGLKAADPNDKARVIDTLLATTERPECRCYEDSNHVE